MAAWRSIPLEILCALGPSCWWRAMRSSAKATFVKTRKNCWERRARRRSPAPEGDSPGEKSGGHVKECFIFFLLLLIDPGQPAIDEKRCSSRVIGFRGSQEHGH